MTAFEAQPVRSVDRALLIPGLFEPRAALWPLQQRLQTHGVPVDIWRDRLAYRDLDESVRRLSQAIAVGSEKDRLGIVTHSFGDWVIRQAIANTPDHRVDTLVSIAPVMEAGFLAKAYHTVFGDDMPEIQVVIDPEQAAANINCDPRVRRTVIWAKADESIREVDLSDLPNASIHRVAATHVTVILQPDVHRLVEQALFPDSP